MNLRARAPKLALPLVAAVTVVLLGPLAPAEAAAPMLLDLRTGVDSSSDDTGAGRSDWAGLVPDRVAEATCGLLSAVPVGGDVLCTHGPDTAPAAAGGGDRPGSAVPTRGLTCVDGGTSGQRVEVLYVYGPNGSAASSARRADVRRWVEQVEWTVTESAQRLSGDRRVRWLMPGCDLAVTSVRVSSSALRDFATFMDELNSAGFRRSDRTYLTFTDATTYCGIATAPQDDDATNNASERLTGYARVDRTCWGAGDDGFHSIAAHELFHTLGAVQPSAPNGTPGSHCTDEHDVLCYDDGTGSGMRSVCRDGSSSTAGAGDLNDRLLDCRGDDYFNPSPSSGSYLARNWNTADHARLHDPNAPKEPSGSSGGGTSTQAPTLSSDPIGYAMHRIFG